jgi:predicted MFS family arabinose efflux permease
MTAGTTFYSFGVLLKPISEDLGASRFAVGSALSLLALVGSLTGPLIGREVDRRGARGLMLVGTVFMSAGFLLFSRIEGVVGLYLAFGGVIAIGTALLGPITNTALVAAWFQQARGKALGISQIGLSASGMVMAYVTTWLVTAWGWRGAILLFAAIPVLVVAPVIATFVVNRPRDRGLMPDGAPLAREEAAAVLAEPGTLREAMREPDLWLIALLVGLNFAASGSVIGVIHSYATDLGHSSARAAGVLSLLAGMAALGKPLFGTLTDRTSARSAIAVSMGLQTVGLVAVALAPSYPVLLAGSIVFGLGCGGLVPLFGLLTVARFGAARLGHMMGAALLLMLPFQLLGLPFATAVFDHTGSYVPAFMTFLVFYAIAVVVLTRMPADSVKPQTGFGDHE